MHSPPKLPMRDYAVLAWCAKNQYRAWYLSEGVALQSPEQIAQRGRCHLLLQPAGWDFPVWLRGISSVRPAHGRDLAQQTGCGR